MQHYSHTHTHKNNKIIKQKIIISDLRPHRVAPPVAMTCLIASICSVDMICLATRSPTLFLGYVCLTELSHLTLCAY